MQRLQQLPSVKLESFEGPFDLLLELARSHKVDLATISLRSITDDFLAYISKHTLPAAVQADFLIVAATLMLIKIRQLLPTLTKEEEQEIASLTDRVRIYDLYRKRALAIIRSWAVAPLFPAHFWATKQPTLATQAPLYPDISAEDLRSHFSAVVTKLPKPPTPRAHLTVRGRTLQEWLQLFSQRLTKVKNLIFQEAVQGASRQDTAVSFLALLEMARKKEVTLSQKSRSHLIISRPL